MTEELNLRSRSACDMSDIRICHVMSVWDVEDFPQTPVTPHVEGIYTVRELLGH